MRRKKRTEGGHFPESLKRRDGTPRITWGEFKRIVEAAGAKDRTPVFLIDRICESLRDPALIHVWIDRDGEIQIWGNLPDGQEF